MDDLYDIQINNLDGTPMDLHAYEGKYILFVNVASECGFTKQYKGLQELYDAYPEQIVVIGVPSNQFGGQEPGTAEEIQQFCSANFGVTFPMTEKIDVKGEKQHPLYTWLTSKKHNEVMDAEVSWNFNKFLISPDGELMRHYDSKVEPMSDAILGLLE